MGVYDSKDKVFVESINGVTVKYVFPTNIDAADRTTLGHAPIATLVGIGVAGASAPKPARMTLTRATGTTGSFVDWKEYDNAKAAGWVQSKSAKAPPSPASSVKTDLVGAEIATNVIAVWPMRKDQNAKIGADLTNLGIEVLTAVQSKHAVRGANQWYGVNPAGAFNAGLDDTLHVKYVSAAAEGALPAGWTSDRDDNYADPTIAVA